MISSSFGKAYSDEEIVGSLIRNGLKNYQASTDICKLAAQSIAMGKVIGWFQGKSEFGPRALGNRSILADPRDPEMKNILNLKVKHREDFRPFAPAVLKDYQSVYFDLEIENHFMLMITNVFERAMSQIPSAVHVDHTARMQTVSSHSNAMLYRLITEFYKISGVPVVINTSFNIRGQPIVETPDDAIHCFLSTQIDALAIGKYFVEKRVDQR